MIPSPDVGMLAKSRGQTLPADTFVCKSYSEGFYFYIQLGHTQTLM